MRRRRWWSLRRDRRQAVDLLPAASPAPTMAADRSPVLCDQYLSGEPRSARVLRMAGEVGALLRLCGVAAGALAVTFGAVIWAHSVAFS